MAENGIYWVELTFIGNVIVKLDKFDIHGEKLVFERRVVKPSTALSRTVINPGATWPTYVSFQSAIQPATS